jgi:uncharacterized protein
MRRSGHGATGFLVAGLSLAVLTLGGASRVHRILKSETRNVAK